MSEKETKHVKTYLEDWSELNRLLSLRQAEKGQSLSFADIMHDIVEQYVKPQIAKAIVKLGNAPTARARGE